MYDMYPWDSRADSPRTRPPAPREPSAARDGNADSTADSTAGSNPDGNASQPADPATRAVQVALDRRDNGGDSAAAAAPRHTAIRSGQ